LIILDVQPFSFVHTDEHRQLLAQQFFYLFYANLVTSQVPAGVELHAGPCHGWKIGEEGVLSIIFDQKPVRLVVFAAFNRSICDRVTAHHRVFLAGKSPNVRSYTVYIYTVLANPTCTVCGVRIRFWPTLRTSTRQHCSILYLCDAIRRLSGKALRVCTPLVTPDV